MDKVYLLTECVAKVIEHHSGELYNEIHGRDALTEAQMKRLGWLSAGAVAVNQLLGMATDYQKYLAERLPREEYHDDHTGNGDARGRR